MNRKFKFFAMLVFAGQALMVFGQTASLISKVQMAGMPIIFEPEIQGEDSSPILGRAGNLTLKMQPDVIALQFPGVRDGAIKLSFPGARAVAPRPSDTLPSHTNYLIGNDSSRWRTSIPNYGRVRYEGLYSGIDAIFYGNGQSLEHDFVVAPGADYRQIRLHFDGAEPVTIEQDGSLRIGRKRDALVLHKPTVYQEAGARKETREAAFRLLANGDIGFKIGNYDRSRASVIDPVLSYSTYLSQLSSGGSRIATDSAGNSYITGSSSSGFPVSAGAFQGCSTCSKNAVVTFVTKLGPDGQMIYSTILGGNSFAQPTGIVVDGSGDAIVSGWTGATDFPTRNGQAIAPQNNAYAGFLFSLTPDGSALNFGTMIGSAPSTNPARMTYAMAVASDLIGNIYVTGQTGSGFLITSGALDNEAGGMMNNNTLIYLQKFTATGALVYSAVIGTADQQSGGGGPIGAEAIVVDSSSDVFIAGQSGSLWPTTAGAYLTTLPNGQTYAAPFVTKIAADAKSLIYSTHLDYAYLVSGIALAGDGKIFISVQGGDAKYPTTAGAYQTNDGSSGSFLTELDAAGANLAYSTAIPSLTVYGLGLDPNGDVWLVGDTSRSNYPLAVPLQSILASSLGPAPAIMQFDSKAQTLKFSTFLGGTAAGHAWSVALDSNHRAHIAGEATYGMYTTSGAYVGSLPTPPEGFNSSVYAYAALIDPTVDAAGLCVQPNTGLNFASVALGSSLDKTVTVTSCGKLGLSVSSVSNMAGVFTITSNTCLQTVAVGQTCSITVHYAPTAAQDDSDILTITSNAPMPGLLPLSGRGKAVPVPQLTPSSLTFGDQLAGTSSATQTVTLTNKGTGPLTAIQISLSYFPPLSFSQKNTCPIAIGGSLAPGESCTITVSFSPASTGTFTANLNIFDNAGFQTVPLSGMSPQVPFSVGPQSTGGSSTTVSAGQTATYSLSVTPAAGYSGTVSLTCQGLPTYASCSFSPTSLPLSGGKAANFTVSIATSSTNGAVVAAGVGFAAILLLFPFATMRKRRWIWAIAMVLVPVAFWSTGCGGGSSGGGSPKTTKVAPGTYTVQVVANDGRSSFTENLTLTVQ